MVCSTLLRVEMTLTIFRHTILAKDEKPIAVIRQVRSSVCTANARLSMEHKIISNQRLVLYSRMFHRSAKVVKPQSHYFNTESKYLFKFFGIL